MLGNRLAVFRAPLPVYADDPVERLRIVREEMAKIKQSKQVMGAEAIVAFNDFAPPTVLAQASRLNFSTRLFNLIVTNVPGPQFPLYVLGRELETVVPVAFLPDKHALVDRDLLLQRQDELRPAGRLRRDGGHRRRDGGHRGLAARASRCRARAGAEATQEGRRQERRSPARPDGADMPRFRDRREAGRRLAEQLEQLAARRVRSCSGYRAAAWWWRHEIATRLRAPLDVLVVESSAIRATRRPASARSARTVCWCRSRCRASSRASPATRPCRDAIGDKRAEVARAGGAFSWRPAARRGRRSDGDRRRRRHRHRLHVRGGARDRPRLAPGAG